MRTFFVSRRDFVRFFCHEYKIKIHRFFDVIGKESFV